MDALSDLGLLALAVFAAGVLRGVTGFGFAMAAVPLMSLVVSPVQAVLTAQVLQAVAVPVDLRRFRADLDRPALKRLMLGMLVGTPLGVWLLTSLPEAVMRLVIAGIVLAGLLALWAKIRLPDRRAVAWAAGGLSGLCAGMAAMPGPPAVAYFLGRDATPQATRASLMVFFGGTAILALSILALTRGIDLMQAAQALLVFPVMLLGTRSGGWIFAAMDARLYRQAAMGLFFVTAVLAGARGVGGIL